MEPSINRADIAKIWRPRGFSCGLWIDHAGREWKGTTQESEELFMAIAGDLVLEIGDKRMRPSIGQEILIPSWCILHHQKCGRKNGQVVVWTETRTLGFSSPPNAKERSHPFAFVT